MRRRIIYLIVAVLLLLGLFVYLPPLPEREPSYQGRRLSQWIAMYGGDGFKYTNAPVEKEAARDALVRMGTNAVPYLIAWSGATTVRRFQALGIRPGLVEGWRHRHNNAVISFLALKPHAEAVCPQLVQLCKESTGDKQGWCIGAMRFLGEEEAIPAWMSIATNQQIAARHLAIRQLGESGIRAWPALRLLRQATNDPDPTVRTAAIDALQKIEADREKPQYQNRFLQNAP